MESSWRSPPRYIQGPGLIDSIVDHMPPGVGKPAVLASRGRLEVLRPRLDRTLTRTFPEVHYLQFEGECSDEEIERLVSAIEASGSDVVVTVGGGKTLDTGKAVAHRLNLDTMAIPTIAATDAPTAAAAIIYWQSGVFKRVEIYPRSPSVVLVDTEIIRTAPLRFLVSGMGDAVATWFEADAVHRSGARTVAGGSPTQAALAIARRCYDTLIEHGTRAVADMSSTGTSESIERIVEANTLLSGIGFESGGLAAAHSIHNGLTAVEATHEYFHGEKVAFATICQLLLEDRLDMAGEVANFNLSVGLPVRLSDLGVDSVSAEDLEAIAHKSCEPAESIHNMPIPLSSDDVVSGLIRADELGKAVEG